MQLGKLIRAASFLVGVALFLLGGVLLYAFAVGDFAQGRLVAIFMGIGLILASAPLLAFPFSRRLAKVLSVLLLISLAVMLLWLVFRPAHTVAHPGIYQVAAIAFAVLLLARVGLVLRRSRSGQGT